MSQAFDPRPVLLVHGLWNAKLWLTPLAWRLRRAGVLRDPARWLAGLALLQFVTGLSNVVLDWPLLAAVLHTGGAAALVTVMTWALAATRTSYRAQAHTHDEQAPPGARSVAA